MKYNPILYLTPTPAQVTKLLTSYRESETGGCLGLGTIDRILKGTRFRGQQDE